MHFADQSVTPRFIVSAQPLPAIAVAGSDQQFPVHRIYCIGRNYAAHAREMGKDPEREAPFFFLKPADSVVASGARIGYPSRTQNLHHEIELVVAIGRDGADIPASAALDHVCGYAVGIDLTRRDLQLEARDKGRPWDVGKGFDHSAPCSELHLVSEVGHPKAGAIWLSVNGHERQRSDLSQLIWSVPEQIAVLSQYFVLRAGDLIFTGTPEGVGPLVRGDSVSGGIDALGEINIGIV
jgi:fumarylpyruvate hydrolase